MDETAPYNRHLHSLPNMTTYILASSLTYVVCPSQHTSSMVFRRHFFWNFYMREHPSTTDLFPPSLPLSRHMWRSQFTCIITYSLIIICPSHHTYNVWLIISCIFMLENISIANHFTQIPSFHTLPLWFVHTMYLYLWIPIWELHLQFPNHLSS